MRRNSHRVDSSCAVARFVEPRPAIASMASSCASHRVDSSCAPRRLRGAVDSLLHTTHEWRLWQRTA